MKTKNGVLKQDRPTPGDKSDNYFGAQGKKPGLKGGIRTDASKKGNRGAEYSNRHAGAHALTQSHGVLMYGSHKACK